MLHLLLYCSIGCLTCLWVPVLVRTKSLCGEVFQLTFGASVVLLICLNIVCVGSSSTSKSWKSPYDPEDVIVTENPTNKN